MLRRGALLALCWVVIPATSGLAHQPSHITIAAPAEGTAVAGESVPVVLTARGGNAPTSFQVFLDQAVVDIEGVVGGGLFTTFRMADGERVELTVRVPQPGSHELRVVYAADSDSELPPVVRRFSTSKASDGDGVSLLVIAVVVGAVGVTTAIVVRRRG